MPKTHGNSSIYAFPPEFPQKNLPPKSQKRYLFYDFYKLPSQSRFLRRFFRRRNLKSVIYFTTFINCRPKAAFYADSSAAEISKRYLFYDFYKLPSQSRFLRQFFRRRNLKALSILRLYPAVKKDARRLFGIGHFRRNCPHFRKKSGEDSESPPFFVIPMLRLLGFLCWGSRRLWCIPLCTLPVFSNDRG